MSESALRVSAVICTRNRPVALGRTLRSLEWQDHPCSEILVVDDSDAERRSETADVCATIAGPVRILVKDTPGLTASRNLAIESVDGDVTAFFDDDVVLRPDYVSEVVRAFAADSALAGVGGSVDDDHVYGCQWLRGMLMVPGRATGRVYRSGWSSQLPRRSTRQVEHLIGCNMSYRTSVLRDYRFNLDFLGYALGEDLELSHRLALDGHSLKSIGTAHIWHVTDLPSPDRSWGYREMAIRPIVGGSRFNRVAFLVSAVTFLLANLARNRDRAAGNLLGIRDVLAKRPPRNPQTIAKGTSDRESEK